MDGFHWRNLPMPDEEAAALKFRSLLNEARRWKGEPSRLEDATTRAEDEPPRRVAAWPDLEIRQVGRGVMGSRPRPRFDSWWHEQKTWDADPMGPIYDWLEEERTSRLTHEPNS